MCARIPNGVLNHHNPRLTGRMRRPNRCGQREAPRCIAKFITKSVTSERGAPMDVVLSKRSPPAPGSHLRQLCSANAKEIDIGIRQAAVETETGELASVFSRRPRRVYPAVNQIR